MPLTLAIAGLTPQEKSMMIQALRLRADDLSNTWTIFWEPKDYPDQLDAIVYCPHRDEGKKWGDKLRAKGVLPIAALPPLEASPSEVPLFVRMPFAPTDLVSTLNVAARRIKAGTSLDTDSDAPPGQEEQVEVSFTFKGANRLSSLNLNLYAVFNHAERIQFFKIRRMDGTCEIWCWPDLGLYWSNWSEDRLVEDTEGQYQVWNCSGRKVFLSQKQQQVLSASSLLWRVGYKAFKTSETLPFFPVDGKLALRMWPNIPKDVRTMQIIRLLTRLTRSEASIADIINELKISRKESTNIINGLIMIGALEKAKEPFRTKPPSWQLDPDEALFFRSLSIKVLEELENSLAQATPSK